MSFNTFGHLFRFTTFGESHGSAIGCVVDGTPPGIPLTEAEIQVFMDKRRPGQSKYTTQRKESDTVKIISGVFEGVTTGAPIALVVENEDARAKDYDDIKDTFRPGHADFTYFKKYGIRDHRGGGRSSARETAMRVAAGAIARKILGQGVTTGAPIALVVENEDARSKDYDDIKETFRPGHADYTYFKKYGIRDHRGGGRSSARETAMRVAAGAIARKILGNGVTIRGALVKIGDTAVNRDNWDWAEVDNNPFFSPDPDSERPSRGFWTTPARPGRPWAPSSRWWPRASPSASARRSTPSSTPTSPAR